MRVRFHRKGPVFTHQGLYIALGGWKVTLRHPLLVWRAAREAFKRCPPEVKRTP